MPKSKDKLVFNEGEVSQTIDLKDLFGFDVSKDSTIAEAIGEAMLEKIRTRTAQGNSMKFTRSGAGVSGKFKSYSKDYVDSDEFKAHGKSASKVNLELTGNMLADMDIISINGNKLKIGFTDETETAKAYNHTVGDTVKPRPFFGVNKREQKEIASEFKNVVRDVLEGKTDAESDLDDKIQGFIDRIGQ